MPTSPPPNLHVSPPLGRGLGCSQPPEAERSRGGDRRKLAPLHQNARRGWVGCNGAIKLTAFVSELFTINILAYWCRLTDFHFVTPFHAIAIMERTCWNCEECDWSGVDGSGRSSPGLSSEAACVEDCRGRSQCNFVGWNHGHCHQFVTCDGVGSPGRRMWEMWQKQTEGVFQSTRSSLVAGHLAQTLRHCDKTLSRSSGAGLLFNQTMRPDVELGELVNS